MQAKEFVKRMDEVAAKLAALVKESDGEAAKYGQDIVLLAAFNNAQKYVSCNWNRDRLVTKKGQFGGVTFSLISNFQQICNFLVITFVF